MKILKIFDLEDEPNDCNVCNDEWNGHNIIKLSLAKRFSITISLCDKCLRKLKKLSDL